LRDLLRRGFTLSDGRRFEGLRSLLRQMERERSNMLDRFDPNRTVDAIHEQLESIIETEQQAIGERRGPTDAAAGPAETPNGSNENPPQPAPDLAGASPDTQSAGGEFRGLLNKMLDRRTEQLQALPADNAGRIRALREYDFLSPDAREAFEALIGDMQRRLLQQFAQGLKEGIGQIGPEDLAATRQMVQDLNEMLEATRRGDHGAFDEFMRKWGNQLPPGINSLDDLLSHLQRQSQQLQSLLDSMDDETRQDLLDTMAELLRDDRLQLDLARLAANLQAMGYGPQPSGFDFQGTDAPGFGQALDMMARLESMERFENALSRDPLSALMGTGKGDGQPSAADLFGRRLGGQVNAIKDMADSLLEQGYLRRRGDALELTPRAIRQLGDQALREVFRRLQGNVSGGHVTHERGGGGDLAETSRPYQFGDPFHVDLRSTLMNAIQRPERPVSLRPDDFEIFETERSIRHATVLAIDTSRSMFLRDLFIEAKKTALALDSLIRTQFPRDDLYVIGFGDIAFEMRREEIPTLSENYLVQGTNYEMALDLARHLLAKHRGGPRQILFITDGEPTAARDPRGRIVFHYPAPEFIRHAALAEAARCRRDGITINTFMLDDDPGLIAFVQRMAAINRGRALLIGPHHLGERVLLDYIGSRRVKSF
jgi:uncharacterized protein with von Willebrand factor type A (vWA) domain